MPDRIDIQVTSDLPDWTDFLATRPETGIHQDPRIVAVMRDAYGDELLFLEAKRDGRTVGTLPLVRKKSLLFGTFLCSVPYFDESGIVAEDDAVRGALCAEASRRRDQLGAKWVELRQLRQPIDPDLPTRTDKVTLWLDLPAGSEAMWDQIRSKTRNKVRKALKEDFAYAAGATELLGAFHAVYARTMRDLGSPPHSRRFFEAVMQRFGDQARVFVVRLGDQPVAASLTLSDARTFHVPWSGSDVRYRRTGANRALYWQMLSHAADQGATTFDFGRSTIDSGTYEFKTEWGAQPVQLHWQYLLADGVEMPQLRPDSGKYATISRCWQKLPVALSNLLGPRIIAKLA